MPSCINEQKEEIISKVMYFSFNTAEILHQAHVKNILHQEANKTETNIS